VIDLAAIVIIYLLIYILVYCCNIGQKTSLACPFDYLACISIFCLVSGRYNTLLQVYFTLATYLYLQDSYPSQFPLLTLSYRGFIFHYITFCLISSRVTEIPPLYRISPSLKRGEYLSKVIVGRYSNNCPMFVDWIGLCPTYNLCDDRYTECHMHGKKRTLHKCTSLTSGTSI
jgi:hypothetical protein